MKNVLFSSRQYLVTLTIHGHSIHCIKLKYLLNWRKKQQRKDQYLSYLWDYSKRRPESGWTWEDWCRIATRYPGMWRVLVCSRQCDQGSQAASRPSRFATQNPPAAYTTGFALTRSAPISVFVNPLTGTGNYSATSNNMKLVHWPFMGGLLHLVQRGGTGWGHSLPRPLFAYQM